ncbi:hypothetical protein QS306_06780 [Paraburkholderia bonniea]|uniref:hypothetical protein n=1 Tax=Paraburkholderia bonniea TaxID=2152891 RepID=UPI001290E985|nr:hypothetical protein [Paraburkholderia bonniea]WJF91327.1 hypothetical protein QS306_06780 [Paraburkholderia bonniea]WJF94642.1 hypothetical protein QS308_06790 [Paraburkholderia bonniea]
MPISCRRWFFVAGFSSIAARVASELRVASGALHRLDSGPRLLARVVIALDRVIVTAAGLWPRSSLSAQNWMRLPNTACNADTFADHR